MLRFLNKFSSMCVASWVIILALGVCRYYYGWMFEDMTLPPTEQEILFCILWPIKVVAFLVASVITLSLAGLFYTFVVDEEEEKQTNDRTQN